MEYRRFGSLACGLVLAAALLCSGCGGGGAIGAASSPPAGGTGGSQASSSQISVNIIGSGSGTVTSSPAGISCAQSCTGSFPGGTSVTLTAAPQAQKGSVFANWNGLCTGTGFSCTFTVNGTGSVTAIFDASLQSVQHIIFMLQENRSFDQYFGHLPDYWKAKGYSTQPFDGMAADASNPSYSGSSQVSAYHLLTQCEESPDPSWDQSHMDSNLSDPTSTVPSMDGFVYTAAQTARNWGRYDTEGLRAMGYYDGTDLPYYYFMASNFGTSDRWFSPVLARTQPNRMYLMSATSGGYAGGYTIGAGAPPLAAKTIFQLLDEHGLTWKIYVSDYHNGSPVTYFTMFTYDRAPHTVNVVPISQYFSDVAQNTLPDVAMIEGGYATGRDEHPSDYDTPVSGNVQVGAKYVSTIINSLMTSLSWKDSVLILSFDEGGGFYDHVPPQPTVSPDGIAPQDLRAGDVCTTGGQSPICDFEYTGFRVPLIVISPFTRKNYVSHTVADYTAILKFIETRYNLPSLTARDGAQMDMTEFFDFASAPWAKPPDPPQQPTNRSCYLYHLP
jgi:phospholipase C